MTRSLWNMNVKGIPNRARQEALACPSGMDGYCEETGNCVHRNCGISGVGSRQSTVGSSPVVWWLELGAFTAVTWVQSVVEALRSCRLHGVAKNNKKKKKKGGGETVEDLTSGRTHRPPGFLQLLCFFPTCILLSMCMHRLEPACLQKGKGDVTVSVWR